MFPVIEILVAISIQLLFVFANPIFWAIMGFVAFQYMRMSKFKEQLFKTSVSRWLSTTLQATGYGVVGGFIGSFIMIFLGLTLSGMGLIYIWPLALLLMIINPRFICFAYAGGILSLTNLLFGWPPIEVSQILALVAILHLVESILIYYNGHANAVPIYAKIEYDKGNSDLQTRSSYITAGENKLVGGFLLQRFWPIPLAVLIILESDIAKTAEMLKMPDWWPIFQPAVYADPEMLLLGLIPVVAALGYGDMAFSRKPVQKTKLSAFYLFGYSVILLLLAIL
ncbi:PDZ domain-containing protein, partial [Peptococcaceae bacterium]|nr:PDZ domain-containing protein [Peptococcaceae bacterium]